MSVRLIETDEMDPVEFRIPASDTKGHNARQWFRCIPSMSRQVEQVVQSKQFPYRTKGDLLRHALHRHMSWLTTIAPVLTVSGQVDVVLEIMRDEEMNNDFSLVFDRLSERISQHLSEGSQEEAVRLVRIVQSHVEDMPDGFWKAKYKKRLADRYKDMLGNARKCNLNTIK